MTVVGHHFIRVTVYVGVPHGGREAPRRDSRGSVSGSEDCCWAMLVCRILFPKVVGMTSSEGFLMRVIQGGSVPAQNVYQCRVQEEKAAALKNTSQSDKDLGAVSNGNQTGPTGSSSLTSFHSQVCKSLPVAVSDILAAGQSASKRTGLSLHFTTRFPRFLFCSAIVAWWCHHMMLRLICSRG